MSNMRLIDGIVRALVVLVGKAVGGRGQSAGRPLKMAMLMTMVMLMLWAPGTAVTFSRKGRRGGG